MTTPSPIIDDLPCIHVCQGPPRCELRGEAAVAAQQAGCPWCKRIWMKPDGSTIEHGPGHA